MRAFCVTSSPIRPSPRVTPRVNTPFSYCSDSDNPSIFIRQRIRAGVLRRDAGIARRTPQLVDVVTVIERQHLPRVDHLGKTFSRAATDSQRRTIGRDQFGICFFEFVKFFEQQVVLAIRDLGRVVDVIEFVMTSNLVPSSISRAIALGTDLSVFQLLGARWVYDLLHRFRGGARS